ncbi:MAG: single-stranded DNA-binding protein [Alphaproteobacteria bacterium]
MAGSINKVILVGNLGRDPEIRTLQNGDKVCNLSVATSEQWRDKGSGERQERTEWHRVVIFNQQLVDVAERFLQKGRKVYVEGQLQTRKWTDQSGTEKYSTEVVIQRFRGDLQILDNRQDGGGGYDSGDDMGGRDSAPSRAPARAAASGGAGGRGRAPAMADDLDDEIPF